MKLKYLEIEDFRSIRHLALDLETNAMAMFGWNGQGKSSVLYAVQLLLHGKTALASKPKMDEYIRDGAKSACITAVLDRWRVTFTIRRRGQNTFEIVDMETGEVPETTGRDGLWKLLGVKASHSAVAMMPDLYLCSKDLGGILADLLGEGVSNDAVLNLAGLHRDWLAGYLERRQVELATVADLQHLGKKVEADRREWNKDIEHCRSRLDALGHVPVPTDYKGQKRTVEELPEITAAAAKLEKRRAALLEEKGAASAVEPVDAEALVEARDGLKAAQEALTAGAAELVRAKELLDENQKNESTAKMERSYAEREVQQAEESLASLATICPTCGRAFTEELRVKLRSPLETQLETATAKVRDLNEFIDGLLAVREGLRKAVADATQAELEARHAHEAALRRQSELDAQRKVAAAARPVDEIESELRLVDEKIARGQVLAESLQKFAEKEKYETELRRLVHEQADFDWAVEAFRDGVLAKELMSNGLDDFCARANEELERFGYVLKVRVEGKEVDVLLRCPGWDEFRPVGHCSDGQRKLAEFAVATAFAESGSPVLLDNLNELDGPTRKEVLKRLRECSDGSTVIVAGAWQQSNTEWRGVARALCPVTVCVIDQGGAMCCSQEPCGEMIA